MTEGFNKICKNLFLNFIWSSKHQTATEAFIFFAK